jgi:membrane-associated protease RseP (regulator of RpoE activity)
MIGRNMIDIRKAVVAIAMFATASVAAPLHAQVYRVVDVPRGWLGISYDETVVVKAGQRTSAVTITDVAKGSPAEKAGVVVGDTLVKLNNFRATSDLLRSMGASVEPGDTVRIAVRRDGRERNLAIEVAKRPPQTFAAAPGARVWTYDPDSVRGMLRLFVDSMYAGIDTTRMRMFFRGDSLMHGMGFDSLFSSRLPFEVYGRVNGVGMDSLFRFGANGRDSVLVFGNRLADSLLFRSRDSLFRALPGGRGDLPFDRDFPGVFNEVRTPGMVFRSIASSESAFAGAALTDMTPDLGEYFGTKSGVLVLNVPRGTPAANAGLEAGDIVTKIDGTAVSSVVELRRAVEKAKRGAPIKLDVVRHQKPKSLELNRDR